MTWDNSLELGVPELDEQHREIFNNFKRLSTACQEGHGEVVLLEVLAFLKDHVARHFPSEEALMEQHHYPDLPEHREQHAKYRAMVEEFCTQAEGNGNKHELAIEVDRQLIRWLILHIRGSDREMVEYIAAHQA